MYFFPVQGKIPKNNLVTLTSMSPQCSLREPSTFLVCHFPFNPKKAFGSLTLIITVKCVEKLVHNFDIDFAEAVVYHPSFQSSNKSQNLPSHFPDRL